MSTFYGIGTHRLIYKAQNFGVGETVTGYIWNPNLDKSVLQTFTEVSDGLYYLDYNFALLGTHFGKFYEGASAMVSGVFKIVSTIADQVWDEILTGATHNIATSAGRRVREIGAFAIHSGTAQAGTSCSITLAAIADANDGVYNRNLIVIVEGKGIGQTRTIVDYDATSKIVVVDRDWRVTPDNTSEYQITPDDTPLTVDHGRVREATANTIKVREYASSIDDSYLCNIIVIIAGTGRGQARLVGSYNGTTKVITLCGDDWITIPDITSVYVMIPYGTSCASCMNDNAIEQVVAGIIAGIADGSYDLQEMMRVIFAACACKSTGGGTSNLKFRDGADSKDRIAATVDANGNRIAITLDGS